MAKAGKQRNPLCKALPSNQHCLVPRRLVEDYFLLERDFHVRWLEGKLFTRFPLATNSSGN